MSTDRFQRQRELVDVDRLQAAHVAVIGCGSLGSHAAIGLARLGVGRLTLYDDDTVDEVNLPSQAFVHSDVGEEKVMALATHLSHLALVEVSAHPERYGGGELPSLVVVAVDSLAGRMRVWESLRRQGPVLVVDGRMAGAVGRVLTVQPARLGSRRRYLATLKGEPHEAPCRGRTVWPTVTVVAALMVQAVAMHVSGRPPPEDLTVDLELGLLLGGVSCAAPVH